MQRDTFAAIMGSTANRVAATARQDNGLRKPLSSPMNKESRPLLRQPLFLILAGLPGLLSQSDPRIAIGAVQKVYVVDQSHPKASDSGAGTADSPWKTIGKAAATVQAGESVLVMEGDYPEKFSVAHSGPGKPIVLKGLPRRTVKIRGFDTARCDYLRIEGFPIEDAGLGIKVASDHVQIVDNHFENLEEAAIGITDPTSAEKPAARCCLQRDLPLRQRHDDRRQQLARRANEITRLFCYDKGDADYIRPFGTKMVFRQNYLHGSIKGEIKKSHTDAFQVFGNNNYVARDILIEENVCGEYHQGLMAEKAGHPENINHLTFRRNIFFQRGTQTGWATGAWRSTYRDWSPTGTHLLRAPADRAATTFDLMATSSSVASTGGKRTKPGPRSAVATSSTIRNRKFPGMAFRTFRCPTARTS